MMSGLLARLLQLLLRRKASSARAGSAIEAAPAPKVLVELRGRRVFSCASCRTHCGDADAVIAKTFTGRHGRAFLISQLSNVSLGCCEERMLVTGMHTVRDAFCQGCEARLGWKYERAYEASQRYKVGCYILEKTKVQPEFAGSGDW